MARSTSHVAATPRSLMTTPEILPRTCGDAGGLTKAGAPCRSTLHLSATGLCLMHDPERTEARAAMRAQGGVAAAAKRKAKTAAASPDDVPAPPVTLDDAVKYFAWLTNAIASGKLDART